MDINPKVQYIRLIYCPDHQDIKENELADSLAKTVLKKAKHLQPTTQLSPSEINCIHGYNHACNMYANSVTHTQKFVHAIDSSV